MKASKIIQLAHKLTAEEFAFLHDLYQYTSAEYYEELTEEEWDEHDESTSPNVREFLSKVGEVELVQSGDRYHGRPFTIVWHFKDHNVYLSIDGWYSSYEGGNGFEDTSINDIKIVKPKQKTITVFE